MLIPWLFALIFPACLIWAAVSDLVTMTIPNRLSMILAAAFVPAALLLSLSLPQIGIHLLIGVAALLFGFTLFAFRLLGGGDAKLIAATALWFPPDGLLAFVIYTGLAGGALSLSVLFGRKWLQLYAPSLPKWAQTLLEPKGDIPYGLAICAGGLLAMRFSDIYRLLGL